MQSTDCALSPAIEAYAIQKKNPQTALPYYAHFTCTTTAAPKLNACALNLQMAYFQSLTASRERQVSIFTFIWYYSRGQGLGYTYL